MAAAWAARAGTRLHASFGTGIRPPGGFELAFTNNPALRPERTASFDAGIEQRLFGNHLAVEATWFYNRFTDLIVSLGGSLARLSSYRSDNLANSRAQGAEFIARWQPGRALSVTGTYTLLKSEILSLDGSSGLAPAYFRVGQQLLRRPEHSGHAGGQLRARARLGEPHRILSRQRARRGTQLGRLGWPVPQPRVRERGFQPELPRGPGRDGLRPPAQRAQPAL